MENNQESLTMLQQSNKTTSLSKVLEYANDVINKQVEKNGKSENPHSETMTNLHNQPKSSNQVLSVNSTSVCESDGFECGDSSSVDPKVSISILDLDAKDDGIVQCPKSAASLNTDKVGYNRIVEKGPLALNEKIHENTKTVNSQPTCIIPGKQTISNVIINGKESKVNASETAGGIQEGLIRQESPREFKFNSDFSSEVLAYHESHKDKKLEEYKDVEEAFRAWSSDEEHSTDRTLRTDDDPVHCLLCKFKTARPADLNQHIRTIHVAGKRYPKLQENRIDCPDCDKSFGTSVGLQHHRYKFHPPLLPCTYCPYNSLCMFHLRIHRIIYHPQSLEGQQFYCQAWNQGPYKELYLRFRESDSLVSKGSQPLPRDPFINECAAIAEEAVDNNVKTKDVCAKDVAVATNGVISFLISETIHKLHQKMESKRFEKTAVLQMDELERKMSFNPGKVLKMLSYPPLKSNMRTTPQKTSRKPDIMIQFKEMIRNKTCHFCETDHKKRRIASNQFIDHLFSHFRIGTHYCQTCNRTFSSAQSLSNHIEYMHELRKQQKAMAKASATAADQAKYLSLMSTLKTKLISQSDHLKMLRVQASKQVSGKGHKISIENVHKKRSIKDQSSSISFRPWEVGTQPLQEQRNVVQLVPVTCIPVTCIPVHTLIFADKPVSLVNKQVQSQASPHHSDVIIFSPEEQRYECNKIISPSVTASDDEVFSFEEQRLYFLLKTTKIASKERETIHGEQRVRNKYPDLTSTNDGMVKTSLVKKAGKLCSRNDNLSSSRVSYAKNTPTRVSLNAREMCLSPGKMSASHVSERFQILGLKKVISSDQEIDASSNIVKTRSSNLNLMNNKMGISSHIQSNNKSISAIDESYSSRVFLSRNDNSIETLDEEEINSGNITLSHRNIMPHTNNQMCFDHERTGNDSYPFVQQEVLELDDYFSVEELRFSFYIFAMHSQKKSNYFMKSKNKRGGRKPKSAKRYSGRSSSNSENSDHSDDLNDPYYRIDKEDQPYEPSVKLPIEQRSYPKRKRVTRKHFNLLDHDPPDTTVEITDMSASESDDTPEEFQEEIHNELNDEENFINGIVLEAGYGIDLSFPADDEIFDDSEESVSKTDREDQLNAKEDFMMGNELACSQSIVKNYKKEVKFEDCQVCHTSVTEKGNTIQVLSQNQVTDQDARNEAIDAVMADPQPTARKSASSQKVKNIVLNKGKKRKISRRLKYTSRKKTVSTQKSLNSKSQSIPSGTTSPMKSNVIQVKNPAKSPIPSTVKQLTSADSSSSEMSKSSEATSMAAEPSRCPDTSATDSKLFQTSVIKLPCSSGPPYVSQIEYQQPTLLPDVKPPPNFHSRQLKSPGPPIVKQLKSAPSRPSSIREVNQPEMFSPGAPYVRPINSPGPPTVKEVEMAVPSTPSMGNNNTTIIQSTPGRAYPPLVVYQKVTDPMSQENPLVPRVTPLRPVLCIPMSDPTAAALQMYQRQVNESRSQLEATVSGSSLKKVVHTERNISTLKSTTLVQAVPCSVNQSNFQRCEYCGKRFKSLLCAKIHYWVDHQQLPYNRDMLLPLSRDSQLDVNNRICPYCRFNLVGNDESLFERHILIHLQLLPYVCVNCSFSAVSLGVLEKHICFAERVFPLKQEVVEPVLSEQRFEVKVEEKPRVSLCHELVKKEME